MSCLKILKLNKYECLFIGLEGLDLKLSQAAQCLIQTIPDYLQRSRGLSWQFVPVFGYPTVNSLFLISGRILFKQLMPVTSHSFAVYL